MALCPKGHSPGSSPHRAGWNPDLRRTHGPRNATTMITKSIYRYDACPNHSHPPGSKSYPHMIFVAPVRTPIQFPLQNPSRSVLDDQYCPENSKERCCKTSHRSTLMCGLRCCGRSCASTGAAGGAPCRACTPRY